MPDFFNSLAAGGYGLLEMLSLYIGPALTVVLMGYLWYGSSRIRVPAMLPGIPLISISVLLQVFVCTYGVVHMMQEIETQKTAGIRSAVGGLTDAMTGLPCTIATCIGCIVLLAGFQLAYDHHELLRPAVERSNYAVSRAVTWWSLGSFLATTALLLLLKNTIDLILLLMDKNRFAEAHRRFAYPEEIASVISHHLVWTAFLPLFIIPLLLPLAQYLLQSGEVSRWIRVSSWLSAVVAVLGLVSIWMVFHHEIHYALSLIPPA
jgi:hypothetical protein